MAKTTAKLSKHNSVQSHANLEREVNRWTEVLKVLAIKKNDPEAAKLCGLFEQMKTALDKVETLYISEEAREIHEAKLAASKAKVAAKQGKTVETDDDDEVEL